MAQYYGVERSSEYLQHYGVRGMKWGVRKAIERGDREGLSRQYQKVSQKLANLSMKQYAAKRIRQAENESSLDNQSTVNKTSGSSRQLKKQAIAATKRMDEAYSKLSTIGKWGFGKKAKAYRQAREESKNLTSAYYNSLTPAQYERLRKRHRG